MCRDLVNIWYKGKHILKFTELAAYICVKVSNEFIQCLL